MKLLQLIFLVLTLAEIQAAAQWIRHPVNTSAGLRGLSVVSEKIIWASGTNGTVIKTIDAGKNWKVITVPGTEKLDFRDVEAFDANTAYILSIGNGENSRIYKTTDGGATWKLQFTNKNEKAFFDAIACWDRNNCIAMSDPVDGHYVLISTTDGGTNWNHIVSNQMPAAKDGEAAFAASGTCLITHGKGGAFLVSGGSDARVFRSSDRGRTWSVANTPIAKGTPGSGVFSIAMVDRNTGVIVGGNYEKPDEKNGTFAVTSNGGEHWRLGVRPRGYRSAVVYLDRNTIVAVGTTGSDISYGRSVNWQPLGKENLNAVDAKGRDAVWAVGPNGNVFRLDPRSLLGSGAGVSDAKYHLINVSSLTLSHSLIQRDCSSSEKTCSSSRKIGVWVSGPEMDGAPHEYVYIVTEGKIIGDGHTVEWDLSDAKPGTYTITAGIRIPFGDASWDFGGMTKTEQVIVR